MVMMDEQLRALKEPLMERQLRALKQQQPQLPNFRDTCSGLDNIKNGFIHFDLCDDQFPRPSELNRSHTAPPTYGEHGVHVQQPASQHSDSDIEENTQLGDSPAASSRRQPGSPPNTFPAAGHPARAVAHAPQPQTLTCTPERKNKFKVIWTVDARKLNSNDKQAVSPPFDLFFSDEVSKVTFKMIICPQKDQQEVSFKKSSGMGRIQLKCEGDLSTARASVSFQMAIGNASCADPTNWRPSSPAIHNFAQSAVCGLPKALDNDTWNFQQVVDRPSLTFEVHLAIETMVRKPP